MFNLVNTTTLSPAFNYDIFVNVIQNNINDINIIY